MSNTAIVPRDYETLLARKEDRIRALLAGSDLTPEAFIGMTVQALARDPSLMAPDVDRDSLMLAILTTAEMGLTPTGAGGTHLVAYRNKQTGKKDIQPITDWRGFIKMAMRSGQVTSVKAELVYEGDQFEVQLGDEPRLFHTPTLGTPGEPERGNVTHVYAVAHLANGDRVFEVMTAAEVNAVRDRTRVSDKSPWVTDPGEMARKTVIRRLFKYLPVAVNPVMLAALEREDALEAQLPAVTVARPTNRQQRLLTHATGAAVTEVLAEGDGKGEEAPGEATPPADSSADSGSPEAVVDDGLPPMAPKS